MTDRLANSLRAVTAASCRCMLSVIASRKASGHSGALPQFKHALLTFSRDNRMDLLHIQSPLHEQCTCSRDIAPVHDNPQAAA